MSFSFPHFTPISSFTPLILHCLKALKPTNKRGPKRAKYRAPKPEHPDTKQNITNEAIHANHLEAFNSALRRRMACYRHQTNTYAKQPSALQCRLDAYWVLYNFIRPHFTTRLIPAVALGVLIHPFSCHEIFRIQYISTGFS